MSSSSNERFRALTTCNQSLDCLYCSHSTDRWIHTSLIMGHVMAWTWQSHFDMLLSSFRFYIYMQDHVKAAADTRAHVYVYTLWNCCFFWTTHAKRSETSVCCIPKTDVPKEGGVAKVVSTKVRMLKSAVGHPFTRSPKQFTRNSISMTNQFLLF